jgi:hypothetical protein
MQINKKLEMHGEGTRDKGQGTRDKENMKNEKGKGTRDEGQGK